MLDLIRVLTCGLWYTFSFHEVTFVVGTKTIQGLTVLECLLGHYPFPEYEGNPFALFDHIVCPDWFKAF